MIILLISRVMYIFGEVTVLREQSIDDYLNKVICISEDDGAALVWNDDLQEGKISPKFQQFFRTLSDDQGKLLK